MMYCARFSITGYPEHSVCAEAAVRDEKMAVRVEAEDIAEGLDGGERKGMP